MRAVAVLLTAWAIGASPVSAQDLRDPPAPLPGGPASACVPCLCELADEEASGPGCFYSEATYLLRWFKPVCASVPIITIGNPRAAIPGALGQPGTQVVVGGSPPHKFEFGATSGLEIKGGWLRGDGLLGVEVSGFLMDTASNSQTFTAAADGSPNSYLPYQAPDNSHQALPFTVPGVVTGRSVAIGSTHLWGVESNLLLPFSIIRGRRSLYGKILLGGRYLDLTDRDRIFNALQGVADPSAVAVGADQFITRNQFAGAQVGTTIGWQLCRWSLECTGRFAAGVTHQVRIIEGAPLLAGTPTAGTLVPGPLLALPSNIGRETANRVTLVPEIGVKSRFAVTSWCTVSVGYTLLYWNKVLCPGDQMSPLVNITQLPFRGPVVGTRDPQPLFQHTDYFAQGLDFGVEVRF